MVDIRGFHKVISRGFIDRHECKRQILLGGVVNGIFDETEVGMNNSVEYPATLIDAGSTDVIFFIVNFNLSYC